jgi:hypothetical protein
MTAQLTQAHSRITHQLEKEKLTATEMKHLQERLEKVRSSRCFVGHN